MFLGTRKIRSAGRNSGSIELTLPALLQALEGVECRLMLRDGLHPEIAIQPNLSEADRLLRELWSKLAVGLHEIDDIGDFAPDDFHLAFFQPRHWQERPPLAYSDALLVLHGPLHEGVVTEALARIVAAQGVVAAQRLALASHLTLAFGDAVAYLAVGYAAGFASDFERSLAHQLAWDTHHPTPTDSPLAEATWQRCQPALHAVYQQLQAWQQHPHDYQVARVQWQRALTVEHLEKR